MNHKMPIEKYETAHKAVSAKLAELSVALTHIVKMKDDLVAEIIHLDAVAGLMADELKQEAETANHIKE